MSNNNIFGEIANSLYEIPSLRKINFSADDIKLFEKFMKIVVVNKGEKILSSGEEETHFRFLYKGLFRQFYIYNGKEINVLFIEKNEILCAFASYTGHSPSKYYLEALESSTVLVFQRKDMDYLMSQGELFTDFGKILMTQLYHQKEQREMDLLNYDGMGRLQHFINTKPKLFEKLPQKYVASYLNIKQETLSVLKKKIIHNNNNVE